MRSVERRAEKVCICLWGMVWIVFLGGKKLKDKKLSLGLQCVGSGVGGG